MGKNLLVINVDIRETRVALIENGIIAELHIERDAQKGTLGNIYLGRVSRVLPGMQAAFIDIGLERAAFLHVEDLIRPDDFDAYLAGRHTHGTSHEEEERPAHAPPEITAHVPEEPVRTERDVSISLPTALDVMAEPSGEEVYEEGEEEPASEAQSTEGPTSDEPASEELAAEEALADEARAEEEADDTTESEDEGDVEAVEAVEATEASAEPEEQEDAAQAEEGAEAQAAEVKVEGAASEAAETSPTEPRGGRSRRGRGQRGRVRRSGRTRDRRPEAAAAAVVVAVKEAPKEAARETSRTPKEGRSRDRGEKGRGRDGGRGGRDRGGDRTTTKRAHGGHHEPMRVSKTTPIREVIREGQEVLVQVSKEPIGTKGARVTSHVSLPGRYVVYLPTVDHVGISKRIGSEKERSRLREAIESMKPPQGGLIVRTVAEGLTKKQLKSDVGYLVRLWGEVVKKRESVVRGPACLYTELDLVLKTARDLFTDDIEKIVIDSREEYVRLKRFMEMFMPERVDAVELYEGEEPIFDAYGIEDEIQRALSRKVPLPSGGHLIIDQAEALTAIDVNTGKFVGKGSRDLEETILTTNLEAVEEIAYQLRFRNIGGLIILDLIDMERAGNREKVRKRLEELLSKDKAKTTFNRISELGLIEMTRKRTRESLGRIMLEPCFYCDGTGQLQSKQSIAYEILRQIRRERLNLPGYVVIVNAHPAIVDLLKNDERVAVQEAERLFTRRIELVPRKEYHLEQFDLLGR
ncbi:Rne/Rng family ribonuclease [Polyangium jinanense]|uniref:Rne/Rng family ribonuclease n=1 Tax=Polyangium jinanense TaxID=2829994 RepID=A0A9X4AQI0_9BACT|nr:Rne/Rng family ribonuclease [Polyangium jinanense]MDC3953779.1 Rne/Rng family ribonuclease [Polyangium jinanense]MDC3979100.1 Rne/Rng family ribonuclease [Polyangium jinanense]